MRTASSDFSTKHGRMLHYTDLVYEPHQENFATISHLGYNFASEDATRALWNLQDPAGSNQAT